MKNLTVGKIKGLQQIANSKGIFAICALDHRDSFRRMLFPLNSMSVAYATIVERKLEICSVLSRYSSGILLDPLYGAAQCIVTGTISPGTGLSGRTPLLLRINKKELNFYRQ